jgi:gliding motility-associated lipoprotein GldH
MFSLPFRMNIAKLSLLVRHTLLLLTLAVFVTGCMESPAYQGSEPVPGTKWSSSFKPGFRFDIDDTASVYNLYFIIHHSADYPFSNIWLQFSIKGPGDSVAKVNRIEIPLALETGQWYGRKVGEIWEHRMPIANEKGVYINFPKRGRYTVTFEQVMRTDPLPEIMNVGLRVEKAGVPKPRPETPAQPQPRRQGV